MSDNSVAAILDAFALPAAARVDRRIPKTALVEHGATRKPDARLVDSGIARLDWVAELSPATVPIPARADPPAPAVNILVLKANGEAPLRLREIIHKAIPAPVVLIQAGARPILSLGERQLGEDGRTLVLAPPLLSPPIDMSETAACAFLSSLALSGLPTADLGQLYTGLVVRVEALMAAQLSGSPFRLPLTAAEVQARHEGLERWRAAEAEWQLAARAAKREKRLAQAVALGEVARQKKAALNALVGELA